MNWGDAIQIVSGLRQQKEVDVARLNAELEEEFAFHLSSAECELQLSGQTLDQATRQARLRFGNQDNFKSQCIQIAREDEIMLQQFHAITTAVLLMGVMVLGYLLYSGQRQNLRAMESIGSQLGVVQEEFESRVETLKFELDPVMKHQVVVMDDAASEMKKLQALRELRFADVDGRSHEVVAAMLDVARNTSNPRVRADVYRQLDEVKDPILAGPLVESLANDPNAEVREEAAESLAAFVSQPEVSEALKNAADNDQSQSVRRHANESLMRGMNVEQCQQVAISPDSTDGQKLSALRQLRFSDHAEGDARTHEVIVALIEVAKSTGQSGIRADIFRQLDGVTDPILEGVLIEALANDSSPEVRSEAAETLAHYTSSSPVVQALQTASAEDDSLDVRNEASRSLAEQP